MKTTTNDAPLATRIAIAADWFEENERAEYAILLRSAIVSDSAKQRGFGTDRFKRVVGLSKGERTHARDGGIVLFLSSRLSGGNSGTYWRIALDQGRYGFAPRVPPQELVRFLDD